mmetsp:Transcript_10878/g.37897  ORF Transcript_10878/g.37897 Transcript_10878/m.37897 type:complete len:382 (-) Transcript_10878:445-1590(-)
MEAFLSSQRDAYPDLADRYAEFADLHSRRLWHQLSEKLVLFAEDAGASRGDNLLQLYELFVSEFEARIDQLFLARIVVAAARQYPTGDVEAAVAFLGRFLEKRERLGDAAYLVTLMGVANLRLAAGDHAACKTLLHEGKEINDALDGAEPIVYASFHRTSAEYHRVKGPASAFYQSALNFLAYTPLSSLAPDEAHALAVDMALGALVGEGVYNFGEVVQFDVLSVLKGTDDAWLGELLEALHHGDVDAFNGIVAANEAAYSSQPALVTGNDLLKKKVSLLCLMEMASTADPSDRSLSFAAIAGATQLSLDQVEWLLMEAMCLGLVKGSIDEVDQVVHVTYVRPRVLDPTQVAGVKDKVDAWAAKTKAAKEFIEDNTGDLFT